MIGCVVFTFFLAAGSAALLLCFFLFGTGGDSYNEWISSREVAPVDSLMIDVFKMWNSFRDPSNGMYCDRSDLDPQSSRFHWIIAQFLGASYAGATSCGGDLKTTYQYSSAGAGMGLVADCIFAQLGLLDNETARQRVLQTINTFANRWPRESHHGFFAHWTRSPDLKAAITFSTGDSAIMALGVLFAGNYFGGEVQERGLNLVRHTNWADAIRAPDEPGLYTLADARTGNLTGSIRPFNEYFTLAYLAHLFDKTTKAQKYFATFMGDGGAPTGIGNCPIPAFYGGQSLLTGGCTPNRGPNQSHFVSSFAPQFNWFLTKGFNSNSFYAAKLFPAWLAADITYSDSLLNASSTVGTQKVKGRLWGNGAGPGITGYYVPAIGRNPELIFSAPIMAGFLGAANASMRETIVHQLRWLRDTRTCTSTKMLSDGSVAYIPWRCSVAQPDWHPMQADVIDWSTMVLGYAIKYLPEGFFQRYAA